MKVFMALAAIFIVGCGDSGSSDNKKDSLDNKKDSPDNGFITKFSINSQNFTASDVKCVKHYDDSWTVKIMVSVSDTHNAAIFLDVPKDVTGGIQENTMSTGIEVYGNGEEAVYPTDYNVHLGLGRCEFNLFDGLKGDLSCTFDYSDTYSKGDKRRVFGDIVTIPRFKFECTNVKTNYFTLPNP